MERTGYQVAENQALVATAGPGAGSRTPGPDHCQEEERHTQAEEAKLPRILGAAGEQVAEHPVELERLKHDTLAACTPREQWDLTWEESGRGPPLGENPGHALGQACH